MKIRTVTAAAALFLALTGAGFAKPVEVQYGDDFQMLAISVTSGGEILIYAGVREIAGMTGVCGVIWFEGATATTRTLERQFTDKISFSLAGKPISVVVSDFKRFKSLAEVEAAGVARCYKTRRQWNPAYGKTPLKMSLGPTTAFQ